MSISRLFCLQTVPITFRAAEERRLCCWRVHRCCYSPIVGRVPWYVLLILMCKKFTPFPATQSAGWKSQPRKGPTGQWRGGDVIRRSMAGRRCHLRYGHSSVQRCMPIAPLRTIDDICARHAAYIAIDWSSAGFTRYPSQAILKGRQDTHTMPADLISARRTDAVSRWSPLISKT